MHYYTKFEFSRHFSTFVLLILSLAEKREIFNQNYFSLVGKLDVATVNDVRNCKEGTNATSYSVGIDDSWVAPGVIFQALMKERSGVFTVHTRASLGGKGGSFLVREFALSVENRKHEGEYYNRVD